MRIQAAAFEKQRDHSFYSSCKTLRGEKRNALLAEEAPGRAERSQQERRLLSPFTMLLKSTQHDCPEGLCREETCKEGGSSCFVDLSG